MLKLVIMDHHRDGIRRLSRQKHLKKCTDVAPEVHPPNKSSRLQQTSLSLAKLKPRMCFTGFRTIKLDIHIRTTKAHANILQPIYQVHFTISTLSIFIFHLNYIHRNFELQKLSQRLIQKSFENINIYSLWFSYNINIQKQMHVKGFSCNLQT